MKMKFQIVKLKRRIVLKTGLKRFVTTGDSNVLILLMSVLPNILEKFQCELMCQFVIGDNLRYYKVNDLTNDLWIAHPFRHAFNGCDRTSSFYNQFFLIISFLMFG